jgi:hypothetical protein
MDNVGNEHIIAYMILETSNLCDHFLSSAMNGLNIHNLETSNLCDHFLSTAMNGLNIHDVLLFTVTNKTYFL